MLDEMTAAKSFTQIEEEVRRFWRLREVPELSRNLHRGGQPYFIYQQPLAVAGQSLSDQVQLLSTTDLLARYRTMRGDLVHLQTGWLCHGLQVEVAVERSLVEHVVPDPLSQHSVPARQGTAAQYSSACWNAVSEGLGQGEWWVERLGAWSDPADTSVSCTALAIGAVWSALYRLWNAGQLGAEQGVVPVCPRCATPLSTSESVRRTEQVEAHSLWIRLPWVAEQGTYLLACSPFPWTLVGMVALAAHPDATYALIELFAQDDSPSERVLLAEHALKSIPSEAYRIVQRMRGKALRDAQYRPPFTFLPADQGTGCVILSKDVSPDQGTGLQILTPAFDASSLGLARAHGLPVPQLLDAGGRLDSTVMRWRGLLPLDAEPFLIEDLRARGLLFRDSITTQTRSLCPYCETPLLPLARKVWQVQTRNDPWIIGRDRAWGVPLPIWICDDCAEQVCIAGLDDLAHRTGLDVQQIEPHRPAVDAVTFPCPSCHGTMRRVKPVVDVDFEASVLSLSSRPSGGFMSPSTGSPDPTQGGASDRSVAVGLGEERSSWLDVLGPTASLLKVPQLVADTVALPASGLKAPWEQAHNSVYKVPADALRWATYLRISPEEAEKEFLLPVWQLAGSLQESYAQPAISGVKDPRDELLGRWLRACLYQVVVGTTAALDASDTHRAAKMLAGLMCDLSGWYALSRSGGERTVLVVLSQLLAPFVPHLAEAIHRRLFKSAEDSVHLKAWPVPEPAWADPELVAQMSRIQQFAALGETARAQAGIGSDLPLGQAVIGLGEISVVEAESLTPLKDLLAEMLRVAQVQMVAGRVAQIRWQLDLEEHVVERGTPLPTIRAALASLSPEKTAEMTAQLGVGLSIGLEVESQTVTLLPDEVSTSVQSEPGWIAAGYGGQVVALNLA